MKEQNNQKLKEVLIGLGSNIAPEENIHSALELLNIQTQVVSKSSVWQSTAVGSSGPDYLNAAVLIRTVLPMDIFQRDVLLCIENALGRIRSEDKFMDRTIDLDVLIYGGKVIDSEIWSQAHVAVPASELLPNFKHPQTGISLLETAQTMSEKVKLYASEQGN